jgi:hypothetical protein
MDNTILEGIRKVVRQVLSDEFETIASSQVEKIVAEIVPAEVSSQLHKAFQQGEVYSNRLSKKYPPVGGSVRKKMTPRPRCENKDCGMAGKAKKKQAGGAWACKECAE